MGLTTQDELEVYAAAAERFDEAQHRTDKRGGVDIIYVDGETVTSRLNDVFGYGWEYQIVAEGLNEEADEYWVHGRITIWRRITERTVVQVESSGEGTGTTTTKTTTWTDRWVPISRDQYGSQKVKRARSTGKPLDIGFDKKGAATDALKKCASLIGVALYLWNKEEAAQLKAILKEMEQEQRGYGPRRQDDQPALSAGNEQGRQQDDGQQEVPHGQPRRFNRPGRGQGGGQQQGAKPLVINGITMPAGFKPPFGLQPNKQGDNSCKASQCPEVVEPGNGYMVGNQEKPGTYVIERSHQEAGCTLCLKHTAEWCRVKRQAEHDAQQAA